MGRVYAQAPLGIPAPSEEPSNRLKYLRYKHFFAGGLKLVAKINLFHTHGTYFFKHYFDDSVLFDELRDYYDSREYRFEVDEDELEGVVGKLEDYGHDVNIVEREEIPEYTVVIDRYEKHSELLKKSVDVIEIGDEKALVLKDKVAKEEALERGEEPDEEWEARL